MALYQVAVGSKVAALDLNQVVQGLRGLAAHPILLSGDYQTAWPLEVFATAGNNYFNVRNNAGSILKATASGVRLSPDGAALDKVPVVTDLAQVLTNKTLDGSQNTLTIHGKNAGIAEGVTLRKSVNQVMDNNLWEPITWDIEVYDAASGEAAGYHSTPNERIVARLAGLYIFNVHIVNDNPDATGYFDLRINSAAGVVRQFGGHAFTKVSGEGQEGITATWFERLAVGEYREVQGFRSGGSTTARTILGGTNGCYFTAHRLAA